MDINQSVIVTGSLGYDYIMDFPGRFADRIMADKIHKISLSFLVDKLTKQFGGTGANIAYTLKLLGLDPLLLACAGSDFDVYKKHFDDHRISTNGIVVHKDATTSSYFVITDQDDNQIGSFYVGAMKYAASQSLFTRVQPLQARQGLNPNAHKAGNYFVVIAPNDPVAMKKYVKECRTRNASYLYDPAFQIATFTPEELHEGIEGATILIGNDYEIDLIQNKLGISHEGLLVMGPVIITTLGSKGSIIETRKESIHIKPAKPKNTSDPTGAGDAYRAGFLAGYVKSVRFPESKKFGFRESEITADELLVCGQMGSVAAVYTVEQYGTQTHSFTKKEFIKRYKENFGGAIAL